MPRDANAFGPRRILAIKRQGHALKHSQNAFGYPVYSIVKEPLPRVRLPPSASSCGSALAAGPQLRAEKVENTGLEPVTSGLQSRRSPN